MEWVTAKHGDAPPSELVAALKSLPPNATPETVRSCLEVFADGVGGSVALSAGNNGGRDLMLTGVDVAAGDGRRKGGGPNGSGGLSRSAVGR